MTARWQTVAYALAAHDLATDAPAPDDDGQDALDWRGYAEARHGSEARRLLVGLDVLGLLPSLDEVLEASNLSNDHVGRPVRFDTPEGTVAGRLLSVGHTDELTAIGVRVDGKARTWHVNPADLVYLTDGADR